MFTVAPYINSIYAQIWMYSWLMIRAQSSVWNVSSCVSAGQRIQRSQSLWAHKIILLSLCPSCNHNRQTSGALQSLCSLLSSPPLFFPPPTVRQCWIGYYPCLSILSRVINTALYTPAPYFIYLSTLFSLMKSAAADTEARTLIFFVFFFKMYDTFFCEKFSDCYAQWLLLEVILTFWAL